MKNNVHLHFEALYVTLFVLQMIAHLLFPNSKKIVITPLDNSMQNK